MKKRALLFIFAITVFATTKGQLPGVSAAGSDGNPGAKSTTGGSRWYDYCMAYLRPYEQSFGQDIHAVPFDMWNDTSATYGCVGSLPVYRHDTLLSVGAGLNPMWDGGWNTYGMSVLVDHTGEMRVSNSDPYYIDSVTVNGWYTRNYGSGAKDSVTDTLILTFVFGDGTSTSDLSRDTVSFSGSPYVHMDLYHDIANNRAAHHGGGAVASTQVYKMLLTRTDTTTNPARGTTFPRRSLAPGHTADPTIFFPVPASNLVAMTATFRSGDTSYHAPGDTVRYSNGTTITGNKFNYWQTEVYHAASASTSPTPIFPPYDNLNLGDGYFLFAGRSWGAPGTQYKTNYELFSSMSPLTPSTSQYPHISYHVVCSTCTMIPGATTGNEMVMPDHHVRAYPNPARDEVVIEYSGNAAATVVLTDMVGQVSAAADMVNGKARLNTALLPAGTYQYMVESEGQRIRGRIVVIH